MASSYEEYYLHNFIVICVGFGRFERGWDENRSIYTSSRRVSRILSFDYRYGRARSDRFVPEFWGRVEGMWDFWYNIGIKENEIREYD
jgi:hypothetical protein